MSFIEPSHPINAACFARDIIFAAGRLLLPDTLVIRRVKRVPGAGSKSTAGYAESVGSRQSEGIRPPSRLTSAAPSGNTSLNVSAVSSQLPPTAPILPGSHRYRGRSSSGGDRSSQRSRSGSERRSRSKEDEKRTSAARPPSERGADVSRGSRSGSSKRRRANWTKVASVVSHVFRASPVAALHFFCVFQADILISPLLRFGDLSSAGDRLLLKGQSMTTSAALAVPLLTTRILLWLVGNYVTGNLFLENSLVVRFLRSRRVFRNVISWALKLGSHALVDPFMYSIIAPIILNTVTDFSPATTPLRYSAVGVFKGMCLTTAGSFLRHYVAPQASHLFARGIIFAFDNLEYVALRRYSGPKRGGGHDSAFDDDTTSVASRQARTLSRDWPRQISGSSSKAVAGVSRSNGEKVLPQTSTRVRDTSTGSILLTPRGRVATSRSGSLPIGSADGSTNVSTMTGLTTAESEADDGEDMAEREQREGRRAILRAIVYRMAGAIAAQCLVQHPLMILSSMLEGRALLHYCGFLLEYDELEPPLLPRTFAGGLAQIRDLLRLSNSNHRTRGESSVPPGPVMLQLLRGYGDFVLDEAIAISQSVVKVSGQATAINALIAQANRGRLRGETPTGEESLQLLKLRGISLLPLLTAVQFTAIDKLLGFYLAVWVRLRQ